MHCVYIDDCDIWHVSENREPQAPILGTLWVSWLEPQSLGFCTVLCFWGTYRPRKTGQECLLSLINNSNVGNVEKKIWHRGAHFPGSYFAAEKGHVDRLSPGAVGPTLGPMRRIPRAGAEQSTWVKGSCENLGSCKSPSENEKAQKVTLSDRRTPRFYPSRSSWWNGMLLRTADVSVLHDRLGTLGTHFTEEALGHGKTLLVEARIWIRDLNPVSVYQLISLGLSETQAG